MADLVYSTTLLIAVAACLVAATLAGWLLVVRPARDRARRGCRLTRVAALTALGSGAVSAAVHLAFGHRPGTAEGLDAVGFVAVHPSYLVVLVVALASLGVSSLRRGPSG